MTLTALASAAFDRAATADRVAVFRRSVAGHLVEFHVAGAVLAGVLRDVLPAAPRGSEPALRVRAWDRAATGVAFPLEDAELARLAAWRRGGPTVEIPSSGPLVMHQSYEDVVSILDGDDVVMFAEDAAALPLWERAAPLLHVFQWWLAQREVFVVHASAVGAGDVGALLVGPSGSGKSTAAMACVGSSLGWVGDDYTAVETAPAPRARLLYLAAKLDRRNLSTVIADTGSATRLANGDRPDDEKAMLVLDEGAVPSGVGLTAILLPRVGTGRDHRVTRVSGARALAALAPSSILQLPGSGSRQLSAMRHLCTTLPSYELEMGAAGDPRTVADLITETIRT